MISKHRLLVAVGKACRLPHSFDKMGIGGIAQHSGKLPTIILDQTHALYHNIIDLPFTGSLEEPEIQDDVPIAGHQPRADESPSVRRPLLKIFQVLVRIPIDVMEIGLEKDEPKELYEFSPFTLIQRGPLRPQYMSGHLCTAKAFRDDQRQQFLPIRASLWFFQFLVMENFQSSFMNSLNRLGGRTRQRWCCRVNKKNKGSHGDGKKNGPGCRGHGRFLLGAVVLPSVILQRPGEILTGSFDHATPVDHRPSGQNCTVLN